MNLIEKEALKGSQMGIGHISELSAVRHLIKNNNLTDSHHKELLDVSERNLAGHKQSHISADDADDRDQHGKIMADAIQRHIESAYPGHKISEIHHTNYGSISDVTNGKHNDSRQDNPSDIVIGMKHPKTGETVYHGFSLKSTQKKGGKIGFKNPTPKTMDKEFGTSREELHKNAMDEFLNANPHLKKLPNKSSSGNSRKAEINNNDYIKDDVKQISKKHFDNIAKHTTEYLNNNVLTNQEGHDKLKHFLKKEYMNTTSSMPYSKITASGTAKSGYHDEIEDTQNNNVTRLLNHPKSKMRVRNMGSYIKYHIQDPDTKQWHGIANEQVKTSSGFGYSAPRHNIHPPSVSVEQD